MSNPIGKMKPRMAKDNAERDEKDRLLNCINQKMDSIVEEVRQNSDSILILADTVMTDIAVLEIVYFPLKQLLANAIGAETLVKYHFDIKFFKRESESIDEVKLFELYLQSNN